MKLFSIEIDARKNQLIAARAKMKEAIQLAGLAIDGTPGEGLSDRSETFHMLGQNFIKELNSWYLRLENLKGEK